MGLSCCRLDRVGHEDSEAILCGSTVVPFRSPSRRLRRPELDDLVFVASIFALADVGACRTTYGRASVKEKTDRIQSWGTSSGVRLLIFNVRTRLIGNERVRWSCINLLRLQNGPRQYGRFTKSLDRCFEGEKFFNENKTVKQDSYKYLHVVGEAGLLFVVGQNALGHELSIVVFFFFLVAITCGKLRLTCIPSTFGYFALPVYIWTFSATFFFMTFFFFFQKGLTSKLSVLSCTKFLFLAPVPPV